jgi:hypothetical protein
MDLEQIRAEARPFPAHVLTGMKSAACFFCAGFLGYNAEIHVYDAGIRDVLGVDHDANLIARMAPLYPEWTFVSDDAYKVRDELTRTFDAVIADPQLNQMDRALEELPIWHNLANRVLVLGNNNPELAQQLGASEVMERTTGSWWAVWTKEA